MKLPAIKKFLFGTLRGRLILSVAIVHAVMMTLFIIDLTSRQRAMLIDQQEEQATALSQTLSTTAAGWLAANDIAGLQELAEAQRRYPELVFAILTDEQGRILAHTDNSRKGQFLLDLPKEIKQTVISKTPGLVDVAVPALLGGRHVGWARIGLSQKVAGKKLADITLNGALYAIVAILIGAFMAWLLGLRITRRLYAVQDTINEVGAGNSAARSHITGNDEAAILAQEFNTMLDALAERNAELDKSEARFGKLFNVAAVPLAFVNKDGKVIASNNSFEKTFGYSIQDTPTLKEWWQSAYPDPAYRELVITRWKAAVQKASEWHTEIEPAEYNITCKNGMVRTVVIAGTTINEDLLATFYDITERKKTEEALKTSEFILNEAQRVAHIGSWELDHAGGHLRWSDEIYRIFELDPEKIKVSYESFVELIHPDDRELVHTAFTNSIANHSRYDLVHRIKLPDGRIKFVHEKCETFYNENGDAVRSIGTVQDITERKVAEEALNASQQLTNNIINTIPVRVFWKDRNLIYLGCNEMFARDAGFSHPKDIIGKDDYMMGWHEQAEIYRSDDTQVLQTGGSRLNIGEVQTTPEGNTISILTNKTALRNSKGDIIGVLGAYVDITDQKKVEKALTESENLLRTIYNTEPECIKMLNRDGELLEMNPAGLAMIEADNLEMVKGKKVLGMINKEYHHAFNALTEKVFQGKTGRLAFEITGLKGTRKWLDSHSVPMRDANGNITALLAVTRDITDQKKGEDDLKKSNRLYSFMSHINQMIVKAKDEETILSETCRIAVNYGQFKMAWLGKVDEISKQVIPNVFAGEEDGYLSEISAISIEDVPEGRGPTGTTLRTGKIVFCNDIENDPQMIPWKESALKRNYLSSIALPVKKFGKLYGVFTLYVPVKNYFNLDEVAALEEVTDNLSFALETIEKEAQRKRAEKKVKDYIFALNQSSIVDVADNKGIIQFVNENLCRISGYSLEELKGQDHRILSSKYHSKEFIKELWETITKGNVWRNEFKNKAKDGSFFWVDTTIVPFLDDEGKPLQFITIRTDITKRKEAETLKTEALERYDLLSKATSDTIWDWDIVTNTIIYNQGISKNYGYKVTKVKNVKEWWDMNIHPEDRSKVNDAFEAAFLKKRTTVQIEYRYRCADGSYKYIFDRAFIIYNNKKEPERMIGSMQDMTKEKEFAIKVEKAVIEAQEREWNQIGMELHDNVNQILAASLLYMGFGVEKIKKGQKAYEEIRESEKHVREAISEIRKLSHQLAPVSDNEISLKQVFESLIETINVNNRFEIKLEVSDMDDIQITDEQQINLYRILQEQLNNIVKHADASEVVVSLTRSGSSLVFSIRDNGKGFDPEMQATGIGLENIKRRAKVFSGVFRLNTSLGKGCEVVVEIPAKVLSQV